MREPKIHEHEGLRAYYLKKGRTWCVEKGDKTEKFKSVESMVERFPELLDVEPIKMTVERRELARGKDKPVVNLDSGDDDIIKKVVTCYYCGGSGIVAYMPCPNCNGTGKITIDTRGL